ncbi:MAG: nucleotide sugar dehydrogenase [uncultured Clostridium sp.]
MYKALFEDIKNKNEKISVIGLGYVGMPLAISFAKNVEVIGFDLNKEKVKLYNKGIDVTNEVGNDALKNTTAEITDNEERLKEAKFHIVAVPTPTKDDKTPDLRPMIGASEILARNLKKGSIVVYESTVYPGVTEDVCVPILEKVSGLKCGIDFKVGYSPERINPGDKKHRLETIVKVVSGMDEETLDIIAKTYELVIEAGVHRASSIKVAEASKVIENSQRDINIAFVNELSIIFNKMGIDTKEVLQAAGTKWNFLKFEPGLVGGHCIGVDPYYLTYKAEELGYRSEVILSGRRINDNMGKYIAENIVKYLIKANKQVKGSKVGILGITFKENCPDVRNSKVIDIINELKEYEIDVIVSDPLANREEVMLEYGIQLSKEEDLIGLDAVVVSVAHKEYENLKLDDLKHMCINSHNEGVILFDIKGIYDRRIVEKNNFLYWRL